MLTFWILFNVGVLILLALDLFVFHRQSHDVKMREAIYMSIFWITISLLFNVFLWYWQGGEYALNFLTGYIIEKALSVDNLFVFYLIFHSLHVPNHLVHRVLFWGVLGAIIMRALFIVGGVALIQNFHWILYILGAFLIFTGIKIGLGKGKKVDPQHNPLLLLLRRFVPITHDYREDHFFVRDRGKLFATPLFVALIAVETTDVIFAVDSIPAIMGITTDPLIIYTSNILAILGLRSLYFVLKNVLTLFYYLHYALAFILVFIGCKMLLSDVVQIPIFLSLGIVLGALIIAILASVKVQVGRR